ncbi:YwiC-like family protein [Nocardia seriolae]|uniref:YwiC-like family protein n=1 Tax=Nocardia seriolae TaxID=37332 RepID=UPI0004ADDAAA|nr:YwiC-like family protein [Nocardia seriolae]QUN18336.1 YwiC-like family protein [Nocardia seriolae]WKY50629.1 YwiC-like family protein [Nocardia seriolae]WNJ61386.1 YwiC-like family protein [Nocardia seriolae]
MPTQSAAPAPARSRAVRKQLRTWLPNQHGAWAMLAVPFLVGMWLGRPSWVHLPLLIAWLLGYMTAFHLEQYLRLRHISRNPKAPRRHLRPLLTFGAALAVIGGALVIARPWLLVAAAAMAPFFAVNLWYAWRNDERALINGLVAVFPACGMLLVSLYSGGGDLADGWRPALACLLYFAGTIFYVKTMIRERGNRDFYRISVGYHVIALAVAAFLNPWLTIGFALFLVRAASLPGRSLRPGQVGAIEMGCCALLMALLLI